MVSDCSTLPRIMPSALDAHLDGRRMGSDQRTSNRKSVFSMSHHCTSVALRGEKKNKSVSGSAKALLTGSEKRYAGALL